MNLFTFAKGLDMQMTEASQLLRERYGAIILAEQLPFPPDLDNKIRSDYPDLCSRIAGMERQSVIPIPMPQEEIREPDETEKLLCNCFLNHCLIFCDTCSLLHTQFPVFMKQYAPLFMEWQAQLYVPSVVIQELKKKEQVRPTAGRAKYALQLLESGKREGMIVEIGDEENPSNDMSAGRRGQETAFADSVFLEKALYYRRKGRSVLVITQDYSLTRDLLGLNRLESAYSSAMILAKKLSSTGKLVDNTNDTPNPVHSIAE